jgi:hypothetical protein
MYASLLCALPVPMLGQAIKVTAKKVTPHLNLGTLSITATPSLIQFTLVANGSAIGNMPVTITATWAGLALLSSVRLYGYFTTASAALTGALSTAAIPTSSVFGQMTTGSPVSYTAFTQSNGVGGAGASLQLGTSSSFSVWAQLRAPTLSTSRLI